MTPDIERLAKEAQRAGEHKLGCFPARAFTDEMLAKFAALVAEECAEVCDSLAEGPEAKPMQQFALDLASDAIRGKFALSNETPEAK